jgi:Holliday junction resolvasome RuvABC endonuclease subunit
MRILALDLSLTASGCCGPSGEIRLIKPKTRGAERLAQIVDEIHDQALGVDLVLLEDYSYGSKGSAIFQIGELGGCVRLELHRLGLPWTAVPPSCLKIYATGSGTSNKIKMATAAATRAGLEFPDDNACDAWWLWQMGLARYDIGHPALVTMPKAHLRGLEGVTWAPAPK